MSDCESETQGRSFGGRYNNGTPTNGHAQNNDEDAEWDDNANGGGDGRQDAGLVLSEPVKKNRPLLTIKIPNNLQLETVLEFCRDVTQILDEVGLTDLFYINQYLLQAYEYYLHQAEKEVQQPHYRPNWARIEELENNYRAKYFKELFKNVQTNDENVLNTTEHSVAARTTIVTYGTPSRSYPEGTNVIDLLQPSPLRSILNNASNTATNVVVTQLNVPNVATNFAVNQPNVRRRVPQRNVQNQGREHLPFYTRKILKIPDFNINRPASNFICIPLEFVSQRKNNKRKNDEEIGNACKKRKTNESSSNRLNIIREQVSSVSNKPIVADRNDESEKSTNIHSNIPVMDNIPSPAEIGEFPASLNVQPTSEIELPPDAQQLLTPENTGRRRKLITDSVTALPTITEEEFQEGIQRRRTEMENIANVASTPVQSAHLHTAGQNDNVEVVNEILQTPNQINAIDVENLEPGWYERLRARGIAINYKETCAQPKPKQRRRRRRPQNVINEIPLENLIGNDLLQHQLAERLVNANPLRSLLPPFPAQSNKELLPSNDAVVIQKQAVVIPEIIVVPPEESVVQPEPSERVIITENILLCPNRPLSLINEVLDAGEKLHSSGMRVIPELPLPVVPSGLSEEEKYNRFILDTQEEFAFIEKHIDRWRSMMAGFDASVAHEYYDPTILLREDPRKLEIQTAVLKEIVCLPYFDIAKLSAVETKYDAACAFSFCLEMAKARIIHFTAEGIVSLNMNMTS